MSIKLSKLLVVVGPTSSGKTSLSIKLAKDFNGEVISADSRQVYKGMDIGTGKITKKEMQGIKHYLLDVVSPKTDYNVNKFVQDASKAIKQINKKNKLPIICGGTMFWVDALLYGLPETTKPDSQLRKKLDQLNTKQLFNKLKKLDPQRAANIDAYNKRRLIRALEIIIKTGQPVPQYIKKKQYDVLKIGVKRSKDELKERMHDRLLARIRQGMIAEVKRLHEQGVAWQRLEYFGLEYRWITRYLRGLITKDEMLERLELEINHYAKRQMTWFKKDNEIIWENDYNKIKKKVIQWLK
ncbi:MAG: tRNA (adenosine(37)-N6)-dimethylallyltransferase MiaA [Candidatus Buchananbacteria bacterium]|nr:tRNA (adenosine(37)-N6)-dimethylallyltransferase MiaA [Candidatus Buchananbacteria bacterium]